MSADEAVERRVGAALQALAEAMDGKGEARPGQTAMAEAVARAVASGSHLVVQAGTGTGKTWAYLVGALIGSPGSTVVVATATKALQDQLANKDLPAVAAAVEPGLAWAVLKGRNNYLCRQAAAEAAEEAASPKLDLDDGGSDATGNAAEVARLLSWGRQTGSGDRAELDFEPRPRAWSAVSVGSDECPGADDCPHGDSCFAEAAYERARQADVIVVNLHLLGAHVASGGHVLPDHDVAVIDEAHAAEDILASALGVTLTPGRVRKLGLVRHADAISRVLEPLVGQRLAPTATAVDAVAEALDDLAEAVRQEHAAARSRQDGQEMAPRLERAAKALDALACDVDSVLSADGHDTVTWVEQTGAQPALRMAPVDVGGHMAKVVWSHATGVLTSATIPDGITRRLGLGAGTDSIDVGSPFDYRRQSLLYVPRLPGPLDPGHEEAAHAEMALLIAAAGGRTLALFTSWRAMRAARAAIEGNVVYRVLGQDDLPKPALIEAFRTDECSCLFATMGFWQGVDIPGPSCSLVTVDRLPFARPDDPVAQARRERAGPAWFATVDIPHAAIRLAQGAGRLIRSASDRGVVAVLDPRLAEADYRHPLLRALPPMRRTRDRDDVVTFLAARESTPSAG
ncbi:MAG: ATP-dependent DNA helicase [Acidimicrobiales bacterium]